MTASLENIINSNCPGIKFRKKSDNMFIVETPFTFPDGDPYQIYLKVEKTGLMRLSDMGHTLLHLSYENDISKFREGTRKTILDQTLLEFDILDNEGEFYIDSSFEDFNRNVFKFGQALTRITDLTFLNRYRAESTFYEDLNEQLSNIVSEEKIHKDYFYKEMEDYENYPIDYYIEGGKSPLFLFGIPSKDKARLTTIVLERLLRKNVNFESLLIFSDQSTLTKSDFSRLMNVGGDMISSPDAFEDLARKINKRIN